MALQSEACDIGRLAPDFALGDPDGKLVRLSDVRGDAATLVMFICNHCPYVQAIADRIARDSRELQPLGVGIVAIMPNDYSAYPDDSPAEMKKFAASYGFDFPYLVDETQDIAQAYGAVCTPEFYGFNRDLVLQYRGRIDASRREPAAGARRELFEAMRMIAETGRGPAVQEPSVGCSIKWREER